MNTGFLKDKNIAVLGFGIEGQSVVDFLETIPCKITVLDEREQAYFDEESLYAYKQRGMEFKFGKIANLEGFDLVFRSPGFHVELKMLQETREKGTKITSATKLFFDLCPCPIIGVTGTKGKGTTSTLIYEMLKKEEYDAYLGGNIGIPPLSFLHKLTKDSKVVLELSSFQLADLHNSPHVAVLLMTTSEHLDYHTDVNEYIEAKRNILRYQISTDFAVINKDYPASNESDITTDAFVYKVSREQEVEQGCFVKNDSIVLKMHGTEEEILDTKEIALPGRHNLENVCAAIVAALCAGATLKSIIPVAKSFRGLEHRIEYVATIKGVRYFDDSFSTTPETAIAAIEAFTEPKILILGGSTKNSDFTELGNVISKSNSIKAIIGIGDEWVKIKEHIRGKGPQIKIIEGAESMQDVVGAASEVGEIGDVVLLSPACASFGMFRNYKERGDQFKQEVQKLTMLKN